MKKVGDQLDTQIRNQQLYRDQAEQSWHEAEDMLRSWPALRTEVRDSVLPVVKRWRQQLMPYTSQKPRQKFVRRIKRRGRQVRLIPWFHLYAIRLRLSIIRLWLALNWLLLVQVLFVLCLIIGIIWVLNNWEQMMVFLRNLLNGF